MFKNGEADADILDNKSVDFHNKANGMSLNCKIIEYNKIYPNFKLLSQVGMCNSSIDIISQNRS